VGIAAGGRIWDGATGAGAAFDALSRLDAGEMRAAARARKPRACCCAATVLPSRSCRRGLRRARFRRRENIPAAKAFIDKIYLFSAI
jgi:hypothetical protein